MKIKVKKIKHARSLSEETNAFTGALYVNDEHIVGSGMNSFLEQMSKEHRTTQQSFTRMCLMWLEQVAERKGPQFVDDRNKDSQRIAELLMNEYVRFIANSRRISEEEVLKNWDVWKPSKALRNV